MPVTSDGIVRRLWRRWFVCILSEGCTAWCGWGPIKYAAVRDYRSIRAGMNTVRFRIGIREMSRWGRCVCNRIKGGVQNLCDKNFLLCIRKWCVKLLKDITWEIFSYPDRCDTTRGQELICMCDHNQQKAVCKWQMQRTWSICKNKINCQSKKQNLWISQTLPSTWIKPTE